MHLTASDFYTYYKPSACPLRVYLRHKGEKEAEPSAYSEIVLRLGNRHEQSHIATFPSYVDLSSGSSDERVERTITAIDNGEPVIYHGSLRATASIQGVECEIVGDPDFLIREGDGYLVRDSKMSRRITERDHPEILRQLELYGWLFEKTIGRAPVRLEVHAGSNEIVEVAIDGGTRALAVLEEILLHKQSEVEPYTPVGWTKCGGCAFQPRCWPPAVERKDAATVPGVDQGLAMALRNEGVVTIQNLLDSFDEAALAEFKRPHGKSMRKVGTKAVSILRLARCIAEETELVLQTPEIPVLPNYVMFDVEGLPPQLDEIDKVYLWGLQVFGDNGGEYQAAVAGFGPDGDSQGWEDFLRAAKAIFDRHGDIPFVHWHTYEKTKLRTYVERYGDPDGVAARVQEHLLDLHRVTEQSVALPLPSYSLKVVEKHVGYERKLEESGGEWSMAKYIEATEMEDEQERNAVMDQILEYNREDLAATWAVMWWLMTKVDS